MKWSLATIVNVVCFVPLTRLITVTKWIILNGNSGWLSMQMFVIFFWMHHNRLQETKDNGNNQNTTKLNKLFSRLLLELIKNVRLSSFFTSSLFEVPYQTLPSLHLSAKQHCPPISPPMWAYHTFWLQPKEPSPPPRGITDWPPANLSIMGLSRNSSLGHILNS